MNKLHVSKERIYVNYKTWIRITRSSSKYQPQGLK